MLKMECLWSTLYGLPYMVYLKYWTLNLMPLTVYPEVLFHPSFSIRPSQWCGSPPCRWVLPEPYYSRTFVAGDVSSKHFYRCSKVGCPSYGDKP